VLWLGLSWCSCGACSLPLLGPPYVRRGRWHSLLPSCIVLGGGVCARVGVAVGLTLPPPAVSIVSMRKLPKLRVRLVSDVPIFTRATHLWYEATVGGEEESSREDIKWWKLSNRSCSARTVSVLQHLNQWGLLCHIIAVTFFRPTHQC
jgi:hypothetical protein